MKMKIEKKKSTTTTETREKEYPVGAESYQLMEEIGKGGSASVYSAICIAFQEEVAIKIIDIQSLSGDDSIDKITQETHNMLLVDHPNVMKSYCSFVSGLDLWIVMPFMDSGSCLHLLQVAYPHGIQDEAVLATILYESLKGLEYLHNSGIIHRDVKAGNILVDGKTGTIKLGDLGVSACMYDSYGGTTRKTFVGTPCWMAPEVMEPSAGYDLKADIWSFGITALELAYGHAPFHGLSPLKVLLKTIRDPPPGIQSYKEEAGDRKYSKSFRQLIAACLVKDPRKRPCAKKLLKYSFFNKAAKPAHSKFLVQTMLKQLPLTTFKERVKSLRDKQDNNVAEKMELLSDCRYKGGISEWDFDMESIKKQTSLLPDDGLDVGASCSCCSTVLTGEFDTEKPIEAKSIDMKLVQGVHNFSGTGVLQASSMTSPRVLNQSPIMYSRPLRAR